MVSRKVRVLAPLSFAVFSFLLLSCSGSNTEPPQEPIAPEPDTSVYPGDPDIDPLNLPGDGLGEGDMPSDLNNEELPGALTDDPFGAPTDGTEPYDTVGDLYTDTMPADGADLPPADSDQIKSAFEDNQPAYEPTPVAPASQKAGAKKNNSRKTAPQSIKPVIADSEGGGEGKQVRYVKALLLNVRSAPNLTSPIVRRLLGGAKVNVDIQGAYARLRDGEYVRTKYLSTKPTKKTSRSAVQKAWQRSKYKDTWQPPAQ